MSFLSWFLAILASFGGLFLFRLFKRKKFKDSWKENWENYLIRDLFSFGFALDLGFILAFIFYFAFPRFSLFEGFLFFLSLSLTFIFFSPAFLFGEREEKAKFPINKTVCLSLLLVGLFLEAFLFNAKAYPIKGDELCISSLSTSSLVSGGYKKDGENIVIENGGEVYVAYEGESNPENIYFEFANSERCNISAKTYWTADFLNYSYIDEHSFNGANDNFNVLALKPSNIGENVAKGYKIVFNLTTDYYNAASSLTITSISFNTPFEFDVSLFRLGAYFTTVIFFSFLEYFAKKEGKSEAKKAPYLIIVGGMAALFLAAIISIFAIPGDSLVSYPIATSDLYAHTSGSTGKTDIFVSMFDAFKKGRISLDLEVDPALAALSNPWDPGERSAAKVTYYWDHAFYKGQYYSYYGPMPVLLVSFPFYFLSGCKYALTAFGLELIGMSFLIPAFLLLMLEVFSLVQKKINWPQYCLFSFVGLVTSMMIMTATWKDGSCHEAIYHVPDIYGLAFFDLFFFFALRAYRNKNRRTIDLAFSGLFFVFLIFSRPNLFFVLIAVAPFFFGMLFDKEVPTKKKILQFSPLFAILLIGGVVACYYNYARFDSIFEFGQSYQLNVTDQRHLTYSASKILPTFFHFYCQGGIFYNEFPYMSCSVIRYNFETTSMAPYVSGYYGILGVPMFISTFLSPFVFRKETRKALSISMILYPVMLFVFAFTTYSKAGICARYLIELYHLATIGSLFTILKLKENSRNSSCCKPMAAALFCFMFVSVFVCLNLSFDSFDGMKEGSCGGFLEYFRAVFNSYNY